MHLKRISLSGFKSFADHTRLEFEPGVNVVVGPNGAGKSNLVDAVSWVLGTQATSTLRTDRMEDVIFSGTATRPARDQAEVSLTFDNGEGGMALDLAEITVTRRLHRDGTSEYEINGTPCRLLDIQELLSDSNVGRHQHVIVAQGRITSILSAKPEEHRAVVEEAAGVVKHRSRRDRSIRRLERTAEDVKRLQDILREQHKLMRPLRRQAKAAERHDAVKAQARALRLWLGGEELRRLTARIGQAEDEQTAANATVERSQAELGRVNDHLAGLEASAGEAGKALERDTAAAARLETTAERLHRVATVARERRVAAQSAIAGKGARRRDLELEAQALRRDLDATAGQARVAEAKAEHAELLLRQLEDEERSLAEQDQLPAEGVVAALRGDLAALDVAAERDRRELETIDHRLEVLAGRIADEQGEADRLGEEIRRTDSEVAAAAAAFDRAAEDLDRERARFDAVEERHHAASFGLTQARARLEALEAVVAGISNPATRDRATEAAGVVATIQDRLGVPTELAKAVEAALGVWADALVATDPAAVVAMLKGDDLGGVPVVGTRSRRHAPAPEAAAELGVDALVDLLDGPDRTLAAALLGDVVVVEGWATAWELIGRHPALRAVTPEGDLITAAGIAPADPAGISPAAVEDAAAEAEVAEAEAGRTASLTTAHRRSLQSAQVAERAARESLEVLEARLAGATEALALIQRTRAQSEAEVERLALRKDSLQEAARLREERRQELGERLAAFEGEIAEQQAAWEALAARRADVARRRETAAAVSQQAAATRAAAKERHTLTERRLTAVTVELSAWEDEPAAVDLPALERVEELAKKAMVAVRGHVDALRSRQRHLRQEAGLAGSKVTSAYDRRKALEDAIAEARQAVADRSIELAELRTRREGVAEALRREADASEEQALAAPQPALDEGADPPAVLESLESDLRRMGPVNPLAAEEYSGLAEQADFLEAQLADLEESRRELRKVISALDERIAVEFRAAFDEVARHFEENFTRLFPGGRGRLRLTQPDDLLETGIEVEAQPLGKRVSRLSLLSGGERSLAAIAFLFAVFRARPSPFYVLDEVEAALDDANLRRFIRLVAVLRESSQLVIVTHQQQTMEAGDMLYGVTMEPGESSRVLAKRLERVRI